MISTPSANEPDRKIVILRRRPGGWSALLGTASGGTPTVEETRFFEQARHTEEGETTAPTDLEAWLDENGTAEVHMLIPGGLTISRVLNLTPEEDEDPDQTLHIQAESHLLGGAPAHRVGMVAIPERYQGSSQGIVMTWPETTAIDAPPVVEQPACIPETAALLAMTPREKMDTPLLHVDRATESLSMIMEVDGRLVVRSTRESNQDESAWKDAVCHAVVETAVTANESLEAAESMRRMIHDALQGHEEFLLIPAASKQSLDKNVQGTGDDSWWQEWGILVGGFLAAAGPLQPLTTLLQNRPVQSGGVLGETVRAFSMKSLVIPILVAALFTITLLPIVSAWTRLQIIENKIDDQQKLTEVLKTTEMQKGLYKEISKRSWPMTKLLGDLANCVPLGIEAESIILNEGDSVILRGSAGAYKGSSPTDLIETMLLRMDETDVFSDFNYSEEPINSGGRVNFSIIARVQNPFIQIRSFQHDFAKTSHAQLRYPHAFNEDGTPIGSTSASSTSSSGNTASASAESPTQLAGQSDGSDPSSGTMRTARSDTGSESDGSAPAGVGRSSLLGPRGGASSTRRPTSSSSRSGSVIGSTSGATRRSQGTGARSSGGPAPVPESPTNNELAAMTKSEAKDLLTRIAEARQRDDLDEATNDRLKTDFNRVLEHMRTASDDGGGG